LIGTKIGKMNDFDPCIEVV